MSNPTYGMADNNSSTVPPARHVNVSATAEDPSRTNGIELESMYSVVQDDHTPTVRTSHESGKRQQSRNSGDSSQGMYSILRQDSSPVTANHIEADIQATYSVIQKRPSTLISGQTSSRPLSSHAENSEKPKSSPQLIHVRWCIVVFIMLVLLAVLIAASTVGFVRVARLESQLNRNASTTPTAPPTVNSIIANTVHSHLGDFFTSNENLFSLVRECISRGQSTDNCVRLSLALYGTNELIPAPSCRELYRFQPNNSDFYWVTDLNGTSVRVYCEMSKSCGNVTGGLTRLAVINDETRSTYCVESQGFMVDRDGCVRVSPNPGCSNFTLPVVKVPHSHICGMMDGSSFATVDGFVGSSRHSANITVNDNYVDGVSLTTGSPRQITHIWTFSAQSVNCSIGVPEFVGQYHSCIRDASFCQINRESCVSMFERVFQNMLSQEVEVRLCQDESRDVGDDGREGLHLRNLELYVW